MGDGFGRERLMCVPFIKPKQSEQSAWSNSRFGCCGSGGIWFVLRLVLFSAIFGFILNGCNMVDYSRADGGLVSMRHDSKQPLTHSPWAVDSIDGNSSLVRLGAEQNPRILAAYGGEYHDTRLERMVAKIVGRLTSVSDNPNQTYRVVILNSPNINAFALPGGYVYVTRGLLALANDSAEVAAVIAHEMEHINANHGLLRRDKEQEIALSDRVANEVLAGQLRDETLIRGKLKLASFSREQELQADAGGIRMIAAAGYDPFASPRFLQTMEDYSHFRGISGAKNANLDFLSNHPSTPQRIKLAVAAARKAGAPGVGDIDRDSFLRGIDGMIFGDSANDYGFYVRGQTFIDIRTGLLFAVPRDFSLSYRGNVVMATGSGDTALRFDSVALDRPQTAAEYIAGGWVSALDKKTIRSFVLNNFLAAQGTARNAKWQFNILVLLDKNHAYRFLTAAPKNSRVNPASVNIAAAKTFRLLNSREKGAIKPLHIRVMSVGPGDTVASIAATMHCNDYRQHLFRVINALTPNQILRRGDKVKIITP